MPQISVIVPIYKTEKYLRRCVDSILAQTFSNFELLLVDDGSPDESPAICDEYAQKDPRICVIHKVNGGASSARNAGLDASCGKYIMFCDSDDYVDPRWCEEMLQAILKHPNAWINCNIFSVGKDGGIKPSVVADENTSQYIEKSFYEIDELSLSGSLCNKIYVKETVHLNGLRFKEDYIIGEDVDFNVRYYKLCNVAILVKSALYYYCCNENSLTTSYKPDSFSSHRTIFSARLPYIEQEHLVDYADKWLWRFLKMLNEVHDPQNTMTFCKRMRYCQEMMNTAEFRYCVDHASGNGNSDLFMKILRTHNYYLFWLFQKVSALKANAHRK